MDKATRNDLLKQQINDYCKKHGIKKKFIGKKVGLKNKDSIYVWFADGFIMSGKKMDILQDILDSDPTKIQAEQKLSKIDDLKEQLKALQ